jgi:hypothetical protein
MARRRGRPESMDVEARRKAARAATKRREGEVVDEKDKQGDEVSPPEYLAEITRQRRNVPGNNELRVELARQKVRLRNGAEMEWGQVWALVKGLRAMQDPDYPDGAEAFAALVALVKPRGATRLPDEVSPKGLKRLKSVGLVGADGSVDQDYATVLDASYKEAKNGDGVVVVDPVVYDRKFVKTWAPVAEQIESLVSGLGLKELIEAARRRKGGQGERPSR